MAMTRSELLRAYCVEPLVVSIVLSVSVNAFGLSPVKDFMHSESRDCLSLLTVLLGATLALWVGLFWVSTTQFGQWLSAKEAMGSINASYVASIFILLFACLLCIICAYVGAGYTKVQLGGCFFVLYGLATIPTMLNNTHKLLALHGLYGRQAQKPSEVRSIASK